MFWGSQAHVDEVGRDREVGRGTLHAKMHKNYALNPFTPKFKKYILPTFF